MWVGVSNIGLHECKTKPESKDSYPNQSEWDIYHQINCDYEDVVRGLKTVCYQRLCITITNFLRPRFPPLLGRQP